MPATLVITVIGPDRPGLVESLARTINEHGGNWTRSRMAHLGGQFAGMLQVTIGGNDEAENLKTALEASVGDALQVMVTREESAAAAPASGKNLLKLELIGQDRTGIVREISRILAAHQINVEELTTECESAPWSGEILFKTQASLTAPTSADLDALREDLEAIAHDLMVEISLVRPA
ncbi:MAG: glycine cleavage system protein R [Verrucomicrobiae bacterium]|nr:glycine cleavage system protein R [Verrucomicrobiae bacterium]